MAKYSKAASKKVEEAMHEMKEGKLKSGRSGKKVTSRKQAIAIGLSEAKEKGAKVPKKAASKSGGRSKSTKSASKSSARSGGALKSKSKSSGRSKAASKGGKSKGSKKR